MIIIHPAYEILDKIDGDEILRKLELYGRTCYKSEERITDESYKKFIKNIMSAEHESVIEHEKISVRFICSRSFTHELVRHRLASYSQESTRYCNYSKSDHVTFIIPWNYNINAGEYKDLSNFPNDEKACHWGVLMQAAEIGYLKYINYLKCSPQEARMCLPNSTKTEIIMTANLREWRHVFKLRTSQKAHPEMRQLMIPLCYDFKKMIPYLYDDINLEP
jgi:thymidylate synthase (FAD)